MFYYVCVCLLNLYILGKMGFLCIAVDVTSYFIYLQTL